MKISILTLFPEMFQGPFEYSIVKNAREKNIVKIETINIRDFGIGKHKMVDDTAYGGGKGMIMRVDILDAAITASRDKNAKNETVILLDARGRTFTQKVAKKLSQIDHLILICGHYEGVDERVRDLVDETISIGDFIITGGEIPAMLITDAVTRLVQGVLADEATEKESFSLTEGNLEYPQYTRPQEYKNMSVPDVLLSGNHAKIDSWREEKAKEITAKHRPDITSSQNGGSADELAT